MPASAVDRAVRVARRRLFAESLLRRLVSMWVVGLLLALLWFVAEPLLLAAPPDWLRWTVLGGLLAGTTIAAGVRSVRKAASPLDSALDLDSRFELRERLTTALALTPALRATPVGKAVLADAETHAGELSVHEKFPVRLRRSAAWLPLLGGLIAVVAFAYHPITDSEAWAAAKRQQAEKEDAKTGDDAKRQPPPKLERKPRTAEDRPNKSAKLKELEAELDRLEREARAKPPNAADKPAEKVTEITAAEERAKAFERESFDKLARIEQKLQQLDKLTKADEFKDGPAKEFNDALAKGDLQKAEEQVEELAKKLRDNKLDKQQAEQLAKQLDRMKDELQRLSRNQDQQDKLKELIDQAKSEGRDPSGLQNELDRLKADAQQNDGLDRLAEKLGSAKAALQQGKGDEAAKQLEAVAGQLKSIEGDVKDLQDVQDQVQRLEGMKAQATGMQPGGMGNQPGTQPGDGGIGNGNGPNATGAGVASGARPDNPNAKTARGPDEKQRTPFDPKGRKVYNGPVAGPAFTKKSPTELGGAIDQAAQEAPDAIAGQTVSRDDKDAVKEFFRGPGAKK